jgi:hypothetical protein
MHLKLHQCAIHSGDIPPAPVPDQPPLPGAIGIGRLTRGRGRRRRGDGGRVPAGRVQKGGASKGWGAVVGWAAGGRDRPTTQGEPIVGYLCKEPFKRTLAHCTLLFALQAHTFLRIAISLLRCGVAPTRSDKSILCLHKFQIFR